ncbi:NAD(P)/FAD-dependent oxidoreductase [Glycomyces buryatensis]|uniref:FAD-dependent oxidoreductase n=1 Tax=Glycomyces buryatensis TaxID=2570927 RepID=A0A4S8QHQ5_9ACTN|nr:FAD-dependent oxidoreductase [Glycomyces buryatensis]THV42772.1 FAD-dependent oxidoreductase [Glycomyces buryatensis]
MTENIEVVVIGGGYSGVMAANRLTQRDDVTVTLINPRPTFVERIRLHQLVGGSDDAVVEYREVLSGDVKLVIDTVTRIDAPERTIELKDGTTAGYDYLIYAVGSGSAAPSVPGAAEFAYPISSLEEAQRLRSVLQDVPESAPVTVVGGGPSGIETAAELAELGRNVTLLCGTRLGPYLHPNGRRSVAKGLAKLGVDVLDGPESRAMAVAPDNVQLAGGRKVPSAVTIWTVGFSAPDLASRSGLRTDDAGRLLTDETLTSVSDDRVFATGDASAPSGMPVRMSCQAALPSGSKVADTVLSRIAGEQPEDLTFGIAAMCVSLGRRDGVFQFAHKDDTAMWLRVSGRAGAKMKELACHSPIEQMEKEAQKPGSHSWLVKDGGRRERLQAKANESSPKAARAS